MHQNIKVLKILLAEAPPSSQAYIRPFKMKWEEGFTDALMESTNDGTNLSAGAIQNVAQQMLVPSAAPMGEVQIPNGFGNMRLTVTMVIELEDIAGRKTQEILSGYSDINGMHDNGLNSAVYDDNMRFFFNNLGTLQITAGHGAGGYGMYQYSNATEILTPLSGWDVNEQIPIVNRNASSMRPKDVLASLGNGALNGMAGDVNGAPVMGNSTYQFGTRPKRSSWDNNISSEFVSRVFTGVRDTMLNAESDSRQYGNALQTASEQKFINEPLSASSGMLALLSRRSQYKQDWSVTLGELVRIDPSIKQRIQPVKLTQQQKQTAAAIMGGSQGWHETSFNSQIAQLATLILPTAMAKFALGSVHFIAHTETLDGSVDLRIVNMHGVAEGINPRPIMDMIKRHLAFEVYPMLTQSGRFQVYIEANISLGRISTITVGVNGGVKEPFMISTYCSALYSPCLAPNVGMLDTLSSELSKVASQLTAASINSGPGILRPDGSAIRNLNYGHQSVSSVPLATLNINPSAPGNTGGNGGLGF